VNSGIEVICKLEEDNYDLILMDVHMPEMDGIETTQRIRECEVGSAAEERVTIVAVTGNSQEDHARIMGCGCDEHIVTPVKLEELEKVLTQWGIPICRPGWSQW